MNVPVTLKYFTNNLMAQPLGYLELQNPLKYKQL